jgi:hypothetical protein
MKNREVFYIITNSEGKYLAIDPEDNFVWQEECHPSNKLMAWFTAHQAKVFMVENFGNVCADYYHVEEVTYDAYSDEVSMSIVADGN